MVLLIVRYVTVVIIFGGFLFSGSEKCRIMDPTGQKFILERPALS